MAETSVRGLSRWDAGAALVFALVFSASLFGILTRPVGFLAAFWPANALLLGAFVRWPALRSATGWAAAILGYFAADLSTGGTPLLTAWLTAANLAYVAVGLWLYSFLSVEDRELRRPLSVLLLFGITVIAALGAALVGAGAAPIYFDKDLISGAAFWFTTELTNGIIVLPVMLTVPPAVAWARIWAPLHDPAGLLIRSPPALVLTASVVLGFLVGGPGALAFPVPALLWCALTYPLFTTVVLTMLVSTWHLVAVSAGLLASPAHLDGSTMSSRLGIMLLALGPLTVASINAARSEALRQLEHLATFDMLTGTLSRAAFLTRGARLIARCAGTTCVGVLMLDIDRFKHVNDSFGHSAGDLVLSTFSQVVRESIRTEDVFGRVGGEEFAIVLPNLSRSDALSLAERIRENVANSSIPLDADTQLKITVSIGVVHQAEDRSALFDALLMQADRALYQAKSTGRNRVIAPSHENS